MAIAIPQTLQKTGIGVYVTSELNTWLLQLREPIPDVALCTEHHTMTYPTKCGVPTINK